MDIPKPIADLTNLKFWQYRRVWKPFMEKYNCQKVCEIGVMEGKNFNLMIEHQPKVAVAVDSWIEDGIIAHNDARFTQKTLDKQYQSFVKSMADKPFVKVLREYSVAAALNFLNNYFDFIYIDADHSFEGCLADIDTWYPKVKRKGFLVGDDYRNGMTSRSRVKIGVIEAVNRFAKDNNLKVHELPRHSWAIIKP